MPEAEAPPPPELPPKASVRALTCPSCGGTVTLRAAGYSVTVGCEYCGSILDVTDPQVKLVVQYNQQAGQIEIPLGTRGTLRGLEWEAIGYLRRSEGGDYPWEEYLLFNPYHGYRWLITDGRGWSFGETLTVTPDSHESGMGLALDGELYRPFFASGRAQVDYVFGEFYWRVTAGETVETDDWVRPGFMLSREANDYEVSWTRSELLSDRDMRAFGVASDGPHWPPMPHQPSPWGAWLGGAWKIALGAFVFMLAIMMFMGGSEWVTAGSFAVPTNGGEATATLGPIELNRPYQRVDIRARVPALDQGWVDLDYALVRRSDQRAYTAYGAAERYSGRDSDGAWTEGSRGDRVSIAAVPAGTYDVVVEFKGNRWASGQPAGVFGGDSGWMDPTRAPQVEIEVRRGGLFVSSLLIALVLVLIPLIWGFLRHAHFEYARASQSDFEPTGLAGMFKSDEDDDE